MKKRKFLVLLLAVAMIFSFAACGSDDGDNGDNGDNGGDDPTGWVPNNTISLIIPASAGGTTDLSARIWAQYAADLIGTDIVVVNAGGAAGSVAANQVMDADPDGYTVLYGHNLVNVANIAGVTDYNYEAFDLGPNFCTEATSQLYVPTEKYATLDAYIAAAKANPGQLNVATEVGAYTYYLVMGFADAAGIDIDLIDAGSNAEKIAAMLGGQVDMMPNAYGTVKDYVENGDFLPLGVAMDERDPSIADIPTFKEQGIDYSYPALYFSFYFPKGTPAEVIEAFDSVTKQVSENADAVAALNNLAMSPYYLSPTDAAANDASIFATISGIAANLE